MGGRRDGTRHGGVTPLSRKFQTPPCHCLGEMMQCNCANKQRANSLIEGLGDMESVYLVGLGHDWPIGGLDVSF